MNATQERSRLVENTVNDSAKRLSSVLEANNLTMIAAAERVSMGEDVAANCDRLGRVMAGRNGPTAAIVYAGLNSDATCEIGDISPSMRVLLASGPRNAAIPMPEKGGLLTYSSGEVLFAEAVAFYRNDALADIADPSDQLPVSQLELSDEGVILPLTDLSPRLERRLDSFIGAEQDVLGLQLGLRLAGSKVSPPQFLAQFIPFLMMLAAAAIGWIVVNRMLMRPVRKLQSKMAYYKTGERLSLLPYDAYDSHEIEALDQTFVELTDKVADDKKALDDSLNVQIALTREVHHRVKNNLQIIASLISLHGRSAETDAERQAFSSIQKRVEALSVVQRNHQHDSSSGYGINLRTLVSELVANIMTTRIETGYEASSDIHIDNLYVNQDTAMPVAFLLTEVLELIVITRPDADVAISVSPLKEELRATLEIRSSALGDNPALEAMLDTGIDRILKGLSQQLRSPLLREPETNRIAIEIALFPRQEVIAPPA